MSDDPEAQIPEPAETAEDPKPEEAGADEDPKPDESSEENPKPENEDPEKTETEGGSRPASSTVVGLFSPYIHVLLHFYLRVFLSFG